MRWLRNWWKRRRQAAMATACPTWAAWAAWTCNFCRNEVEGKGPARALFFCTLRRRGGGMRILVAEDDAILADAVLHSLRQSGYAVDWVKNGVEADCALAAHAFDLLILDLGLPRKSGLDVLKRLRGRDSRLPVLILTGFDAVSHRVRGLDAGADDYLAKPFDLAELEARVRALTRRGMYGGPPVLRHGALKYAMVGRVARLYAETPECSAC